MLASVRNIRIKRLLSCEIILPVMVVVIALLSGCTTATPVSTLEPPPLPIPTVTPTLTMLPLETSPSDTPTPEATIPPYHLKLFFDPATPLQRITIENADRVRLLAETNTQYRISNIGWTYDGKMTLGDLLYSMDDMSAPPQPLNMELPVLILYQMHPDGKRFAGLSNHDSDQYHFGLWNIETGQEEVNYDRFDDIHINLKVHGATFSSDGQLVACIVSYGSDIVKIWEVESGEVVASVEWEQVEALLDEGEYAGSTSSLIAFHPYEPVIVFGHGFGGARGHRLYLWYYETGEVVRLKPPPTNEWLDNARPLSAVFSLDGTLLYSSGEDGFIRVWDFNTREEVNALLDDNYSRLGDVTPNIKLSADGSLLLTAQFKGSFIWDIKAEKVIAVLNDRPLRDVFINPDGTIIATINDNDIIHLWGIPADE